MTSDQVVSVVHRRPLHLGVLFIFAGHLVGLLTPIWVFDMLGVSHEAKQILAVVAGGIAGVMAIIGASMLVHRRVFDPRVRASSRPTDTLIIILLWLQLLLGLGTIPISLQHLDGGEMVTFMNWAQGIFTFNPAASSYITNASIVFKMHIFLGLTIFLLFPFTRLVHMLSAPVRDETQAYAERLRQAGVKVQSHVLPGKAGWIAENKVANTDWSPQEHKLIDLFSDFFRQAGAKPIAA